MTPLEDASLVSESPGNGKVSFGKHHFQVPC